MDKRKPTIKDVARHAGVGIGTVSSVINRSRNVSAEARQKVEFSIKALGFQPDTLARSFRTQRTQTVAFFVNDISNTAFSAIAKGIHAELDRHGMNVMLHNTGNEHAEEKIRDTIRSRKFDGLVLSVQNELHPSLIRQLQTHPIPTILLDREIAGVEADAILTDYYNGIRQAAEYLISLGHGRIGLITTASNIRPARETMRAYGDAMKLAGLEAMPDWIKRGEFDVEFGRLASAQLADSGVTAIIAGSNQLLIGCMETIRERRIDVPAGLSLIGFEDSDFTRLMNPGITVIKRPLIHIGQQMARILWQRLQTGRAGTQQDKVELIVPTELVVRASCAAPARP